MLLHAARILLRQLVHLDYHFIRLIAIFTFMLKDLVERLVLVIIPEFLNDFFRIKRLVIKYIVVDQREQMLPQYLSLLVLACN